MRLTKSLSRFRALALIVVAGAAAFPITSVGQEGAPPAGWQVRTDGGGHGGGDLAFTDMPPGWHITTGPAAIFFDPGKTASGSFRVESEVFLFDPNGRNEAFGIFFGGADLDAEAQAYTYFLIRQDGSVLVKRRDGNATSTLQGWTPHDAVLTWAARETDSPTAKNVLAVEAGAERLVFYVNDQEVYATDRAGNHVDGLVGLRVNHGLNLHVSTLEVTSH